MIYALNKSIVETKQTQRLYIYFWALLIEDKKINLDKFIPRFSNADFEKTAVAN